MFRNIKDYVLRLIEVKAGRLSGWAWDQRWKKRNQQEWMKGYKEWRKIK